MKRPKNMPVVLDMAALTVVVVNLPFALYGYLMFGSGTEGTMHPSPVHMIDNIYTHRIHI